MGLVHNAALPEAPTALSYSATRTHCPLGMTRWQYATVAMHSGSIEGSPKAGPHICSSKTILHKLAWVFMMMRHGTNLSAQNLAER
jgi:hypothetical protein